MGDARCFYGVHTRTSCDEPRLPPRLAIGGHMTDGFLNLRRAALAGALILLAVTTRPIRAQFGADDDNDSRIRHVLLISVDGMHQVDLQRFIANHPHSAFAHLVQHGVEYTHASASLPSDSFPGLMAFMTGG